MNKKLIGVLAGAAVVVAGLVASSAGEVFVSPSGNDNNTCTATMPCKTQARAEQVVPAGGSVIYLEGVYPPFIIRKSGIVVEGRGAVVDGILSGGNLGIQVPSTVSNVTIRGFGVTRSRSHGIHVQGTNVIVENNRVFQNILENANVSNGVITSCKNTGWGSAIKVAVGGKNTTIRNNEVFQNCGEGIAVTRGAGALVTGNITYDNFAVNLYTDNSFDVVMRGNMSYCQDTRFYRSGSPARGVLLGIENYSGWGNQARDILIEQNFIRGCGGIRLYAESGYTLGANVVIRDNVFQNVPTPFVNVAGAITSGNISGTPTPSGATNTPAPPTATRTPTIIPSRTPTAIPPTITRTPTVIPSMTPTPFVVPTICATFEWQDVWLKICK